MGDEDTPLESEVEDSIDDAQAPEAPPADTDNPPEPLGDNHEQN